MEEKQSVHAIVEKAKALRTDHLYRRRINYCSLKT